MKAEFKAAGKTGLVLLAGILLLGNLRCTGRKAGSGEAEEAAELSGSIRLAGSTSMERMTEALAESFMGKYPQVRVTVEYVGSGAGIAAVLSGSADIGNSSRRLKSEEKAYGAEENIVALDGIAVCVDPGNSVTELTRQQLQDIYAGKVTNWSQVGGAPFPIVVIGHEAGSGTREAFEEYLGLTGACVYANELGSAGAVLARIAVTPGAIGYVSTQAASQDTAVLALEGVRPTAEHISTGDYPLVRPLIMVTDGGPGAQSRLIQAWLDYVQGEEGRGVIEKMGLVPADESNPERRNHGRNQHT